MFCFTSLCSIICSYHFTVLLYKLPYRCINIPYFSKRSLAEAPVNPSLLRKQTSGNSLCVSRQCKGQWQLVRRHRSSISISVRDRARWHQSTPGVKLQHVGWRSPHRKSVSTYCSFQRSGRFPCPPWTTACPCWEQTHTVPIWLRRHMPSCFMPCVITDGQNEDWGGGVRLRLLAQN